MQRYIPASKMEITTMLTLGRVQGLSELFSLEKKNSFCVGAGAGGQE